MPLLQPVTAEDMMWVCSHTGQQHGDSVTDVTSLHVYTDTIKNGAKPEGVWVFKVGARCLKTWQKGKYFTLSELS